MRHEEWHITIDHQQTALGVHDPRIIADWYNWCRDNGIKPLYIELNNFDRQLMCAANRDVRDLVSRAGFSIIRIKHEVQCAANEYVPDAKYYEVHFKFDGHFDTRSFMTSRDLFRGNRWYQTVRRALPFDPLSYKPFETTGQTLMGIEYECAILDTNPGLDYNWARHPGF